jgi:pimeloyl-ACP methyl ester carboxylesterase
LKINKAYILGYSMSSIIAQELTFMDPDRGDSLVLYAPNCDGKAFPPCSEGIQALVDSTDEDGIVLSLI